MKLKNLVAVILIALGVVAFAYEGITYTTRGHDVNIGALHMSTEQKRRIPLPPILGGVALLGGMVLLLADSWRPARTATP